jgi:rhamnogalacturonan endolyase
MKLEMPQGSKTLMSLSAILAVTLLSGCRGADPIPGGTGGWTGSLPQGSGGAGLGGTSGQGGATQASGGAIQTNAGGTNQNGGSVGQGGSTSAGGSGQGGTASGGKAAGGSLQGGAATGGTAAGAKSAGGSTQGGAVTGGANTSAGGAALGGKAAGGAAVGGATVGAGGAPATGSCAAPTTGHYQMEDLDRGVVAVKVTSGVYVGWRMLGWEYDTTASNVTYNLYKDGTKLANVTTSTNYLDAAGTISSSYSVSAVIKGTECAQSAAVKPWEQNYLSVPITPPTGSVAYSANDASPGDLDGDGKLDIVLKWDPANSQDSSVAGATDPVIIDGIKLDGTRLWRINLGMNIRAGAHDTQLSVYDFDGDGEAELGVKTAPGTKDGTGSYLSKGPASGAAHTTDLRNADGKVLGGPEWFTVFSGATGAELATIAYPVLYGSSAWGDTYGNRGMRFNGGASFVTDSGTTSTGRPSIITQRGYYTRLTISALNYRGGALSKIWTYDSGTSGGAFGQGCHALMTGDANGDGAFELIPGASTINSNGTFRCKTGLGHGDALHVGTLIKGQPLQVFMPHEEDGGHDAHDASTCTTHFATTSASDNGRGVAEWVSTTSEASASCSSARGGDVHCNDGSSGATSAGSNFLIYWDADEARELTGGTSITKPGGGTLLSTSGTAACNGTKSTPNLTADILGDWREELILHNTASTALMIYTTTNVTARRIYTLMHDPTYRMQVTFEQSSYNQPPHVGFHIGLGMADPPKPDIYVK